MLVRYLSVALALIFVADPVTSLASWWEEAGDLWRELRLPKAYEAAAIDAKVVDIDTGEPLSGVIVDAHWQLFNASVHARPAGQIMVIETLTDELGRFHFPRWGPKPRPGGSGRLTNLDPEILLFKRGYRPTGASNGVRERIDMSTKRRSDWDGKTIAMERFTDDPERKAQILFLFTGNVEFFFFDGGCGWKDIPRMLAALYREAHSLPASSLAAQSVSLVNWEERANVPRCGSLSTLLAQYLD